MNTTNAQLELEEEIDFTEVDYVLDKYKNVNGALIPILQHVQHKYGYLQEPVIFYIAECLNISPSEIIGVATFYAQFHLKPRGKHILKVCCGTACHVKNAKSLSAKIIDIFKIQRDETTEDRMFTFEEVSCLGACGIAPVVVVDEEVHGTLSPDKLGEILEEYTKPAA